MFNQTLTRHQAFYMKHEIYLTVRIRLKNMMYRNLFKKVYVHTVLLHVSTWLTRNPVLPHVRIAPSHSYGMYVVVICCLDRDPPMSGYPCPSSVRPLKSYRMPLAWTKSSASWRISFATAL